MISQDLCWLVGVNLEKIIQVSLLVKIKKVLT